MGRVIYDDPFTSLLPPLYAEPEIFYSLDAYPGDQPAWVVRRAEDLKKIFLDTEHFSSRDLTIWAKLINEEWRQFPAESDPPVHTVQRTTVNPPFRPAAMAKLDTKISNYARKYFEDLKSRGECDLMADFALEFPINIFLELMGLPH